MATYTQIYYHIVFSTKDRVSVLDQSGRESLFRYVWGVINDRKSYLYRINSTFDHMHILTSLHPSVSLSDLVKQIKGASSYWIGSNKLFPGFSGWQEGYGAFTHSIEDKARLIEYIKGQEHHHRSVTFVEEMKVLLAETGVELDLDGVLKEGTD